MKDGTHKTFEYAIEELRPRYPGLLSSLLRWFQQSPRLRGWWKRCPTDLWAKWPAPDAILSRQIRKKPRLLHATARRLGALYVGFRDFCRRLYLEAKYKTRMEVNCPPSGSRWTVTRSIAAPGMAGKRCQLKWCPWCHLRRIADLVRRLRKAGWPKQVAYLHIRVDVPPLGAERGLRFWSVFRKFADRIFRQMWQVPVYRP